MLIKRITVKLIKAYGQEFTSEFGKNKALVNKYTDVSSTKLRNSIAGYAARLIKQRIALEGKPRRKAHEEDLSKFYE